MCGLVGYSGKKRPNIPALKLLSILIRERGKDSVGFFINEYLKKGIYISYQKDLGDPLNFFGHWMFGFAKKWKTNVCIIHNRSATRGLKSLENAHPFEYEKDGVKHYFAHNGTLTNEDELAKEYGLKKEDFNVDSKLLGHIIVHHGFDVLTKYKGAAAFLYYRSDEPENLYIYKGKSLESGILSEERPLFLKFVTDGAYVCSTEAALDCALDYESMPECIPVPDNTLICLKNGKISSEVVYDRSSIENKPPVVIHHGHHNAYTQGYNQTHASVTRKNISTKKNAMPKLCCRDNYEKNPQALAKNRIYYYKGLYYLNGHTCNGSMMVDEDGQIAGAKNTAKSGKIYTLLTFHLGLMLKNVQCYEQAQELVKKQADIYTTNGMRCLPLLHEDHWLFFYSYSELKSRYVLKLYNKGSMIVAQQKTLIPKFGYYKYIFSFGESNDYEVHKIDEENNSQMKLAVTNLPKHPWQEDDNTIYDMATNFMTPGFELKKEESSSKISEAMRFFELVRKRLKKIENEVIWKESARTIEEIDFFQKILVINTIINDNAGYTDYLFEELSDNKEIKNGRYE